jgi:L-fuculose-phosphate aldolase
MKPIERRMIHWGKLLFERKLISGWGGNISCRVGKDRFLITGQHTSLGFLDPKDLVQIDRKGQPLKKTQRASSETRLHLAVYAGTEAKVVIHAHPPMVLAFSLSHQSFTPLSFEEKYTIGEVPILPQETPTVTDTDKVAEALQLRPIVILRGHGTVAIGQDLREAFLLTDLLEEAVHCQFFKDQTGPSDPAPEVNSAQTQKENVRQKSERYALFSREHMDALIQSANDDPQFRSQAKEAVLTTTLTLRMEDDDTHWTVHFENGRISRWGTEKNGEFMITGKRVWWEAIFQKNLDPFFATQQGKLKLERGELWKLSQWFKPFQRAFTLWQAIPTR